VCLEWIPAVNIALLLSGNVKVNQGINTMKMDFEVMVRM
jgi:hypothetical protein